MWHYFLRGPLENRVLKTRFIIQKNFKNLPSPKHDLTSPDQIRSERGRPDKRERNSQIREGEKEIAWVAHLGCATQVAIAWLGSHNPGERPRSRTWVRAAWVAQPKCATQVRNLGCANPGRATHAISFSPSLI